MINYTIQDGCHNCKNIFIKYDYEQCDEYYCTLNAPERPLCMSNGMDEVPSAWDDKYNEWKDAYNKWDEWKKNRNVMSFGKCDLYEKIRGD